MCFSCICCFFFCFVLFCFVRVSFCHFSLPLGVGGWLRLEIVALPGLIYSLVLKKCVQNITTYDGRQNTIIRKWKGNVKSQPKTFWKSLKKGYTKPKDSNNDISLENLHSHFKDLLGQIQENNHTNEQYLQGQNNTELDSILTEQEIRKAVFKQKNGKTSEPDDLTTEIVKASQL